jgi:hypothetical protein
MDINKELIFTELNSSCSIKEIVIITNPNINNMMTSIQFYLFYPLVDINEKLISPKLNSPSSIRVIVTPSNINMLS